MTARSSSTRLSERERFVGRFGDAIDIRAIAEEVRRLGERARGGGGDEFGSAWPKPDNGQRPTHKRLPWPGIRIIEK